MAKVIVVGSAKSASQTIHALACCSGSLLLKAHDEAKSTAGLELTLYRKCPLVRHKKQTSAENKD